MGEPAREVKATAVVLESMAITGISSGYGSFYGGYFYNYHIPILGTTRVEASCTRPYFRRDGIDTEPVHQSGLGCVPHGNGQRRYSAAVCAGLAWLFAAAPIVASILITQQRTAFGVETAGFFCVSIATFAFLHYLATSVACFLERVGILGQRIAVIGESKAVAACLKRINGHSSGKHICAIVSDAGWPPGELALRARVERLGQVKPDIIILTMPLLDPMQVASSINHFRSLPARLLLAPWVPAADGGIVLPGKSDALSVGMALIEISERPIYGWRWVLKDVQDRVLAAVLLLCTLPVLILVAVGIGSPARVLSCFGRSDGAIVGTPLRYFEVSHDGCRRPHTGDKGSQANRPQ